MSKSFASAFVFAALLLTGVRPVAGGDFVITGNASVSSGFPYTYRFEIRIPDRTHVVASGAQTWWNPSGTYVLDVAPRTTAKFVSDCQANPPASKHATYKNGVLTIETEVGVCVGLGKSRLAIRLSSGACSYEYTATRRHPKFENWNYDESASGTCTTSGSPMPFAEAVASRSGSNPATAGKPLGCADMRNGRTGSQYRYVVKNTCDFAITFTAESCGTEWSAGGASTTCRASTPERVDARSSSVVQYSDKRPARLLRVCAVATSECVDYPSSPN